MKNIIRVTAIILTMVTVIVTHPFLSLEAKVIDKGFEIINPSTVTIDVANNTGNSSFDNSVQLISNYSVSDPTMTTGFSISVTVEQEVPLIYVCDVVLNFRHTVDYAFLRLTFTKPSSGSFPLSFIGENIRVQGMGNSSSTSYIDLYVYETNSVHLQIIFSFGQLRDYYGYALPLANNVTEVPWVTSGTTYFKVETAKMTNCALDTEIDYTSYIDGIESQLTTIGTRLNNINTNIDGVEGLLTNLLTEADEIETLLNNIRNTLISNNNITWIDIPLTYKGYTTNYSSFDNSAGWKEPGYYFFEGFFVYEPNKGMYKIEIPIGNTEINWSDIKVYTYYDNDVHEIDINYYLLFKNRYNITIYYFVNDHYSSVAWPNGNNPLAIYIGKRAYYYADQSMTAQYILQTSKSYWDIYNNITLQFQLRNIENAIGNINVTNNTTVNEINTNISEYNTTIQNVFNIENNLSSSLEQSMQQFSPDNTNILQRLNDSSTLLKSVVNQINGIDIFTIPLAVALVGIVLIAIVG